VISFFIFQGQKLTDGSNLFFSDSLLSEEDSSENLPSLFALRLKYKSLPMKYQHLLVDKKLSGWICETTFEPA